MNGGPSCSECGAPLAADQRYCLGCGERLASARPPFAAAAAGAALAGASPRRGMPVPRSAALLILAVLGLGMLVGGIGGSASSPLAGPARSVVVVRAPSPSASGPTPHGEPAGAGSSRASEAGAAGAAGSGPSGQAPLADTGAVSPTSQEPAPSETSPQQGSSGLQLPALRHVFVIALSGQAGFDAAFGEDTQAPYLAHTLARMGELLPNWYAIGHGDLTDYIALISGQAPNPQTEAGCPVFSELSPGGVGADGQAVGQGCVYPADVQTVADQLAVNGFTWKAYIGDMGNGPGGQAVTCRHPESGAADDTQTSRAGDGYALRHNPFAYFHSIIDAPDCPASDVGLDQLDRDLASTGKTANYSFIAPNLCDDGHDDPCADGTPGGLPRADAFLKAWVPKILASPAYKKDGLLAIVFDEGRPTDASGCCGLPAGQGGGRTGALLLSRFVEAGTTDETSYDHYSLLASVEDLFSLERLGEAAREGLPVFGGGVYTAGTSVSQARHRLFTSSPSSAEEDAPTNPTRRIN